MLVYVDIYIRMLHFELRLKKRYDTKSNVKVNIIMNKQRQVHLFPISAYGCLVEVGRYNYASAKEALETHSHQDCYEFCYVAWTSQTLLVLICTLKAPPICGLMEPPEHALFALKQVDY